MAGNIESTENAQPAASPEAKAKAKRGATKEKPKGPFIKYTGAADGIASEREISPSEWGSIGIEGKKKHSWSILNDFKVPSSEFSDEQLDYLLDTDGRFEEVDDDEDEDEKK